MILFFLACNTLQDTALSNPCADINLPQCPPECPADYAGSCGEPCETEGEECGNTIGDGRICSDGIWECSVHAPLEAEGCNLICQ
ncbi:MAG: hypothetical protein CMK59_07715 [Proteobacteria bacterium]|nr:hypothetical protein [Pseudomonadota bacterium]